MNTVMPPFASASLYVGDLTPDVTEAMLFEVFNAVGPVASIRVCRDAITRRSLGYAYVNFHNFVDAERALDTMNYTTIKTKPIRIMWSHRDPAVRKSGEANIFIKNLDKAIDHKALYDTFSAFGNILSCKVATDERSQSKGYGFVHFETKEAADTAIAKVNGMLLNGKKVFVGYFQKRDDRHELGGQGEKFNNVFVKNLAETVDEDRLKATFSAYGEIQSAVIMRDAAGKSKGFGFVSFKDYEQAAAAVDELNGKDIDGKELFCGRAQKKADRESDLRKKWDEIRTEREKKYQGVNLFIKNLDDTVDDERLRSEFSSFGTITSAKIMRDEKGPKGFGFVCFATSEEATRAVTEMQGRMIGNKPLYVALAQRKEARRAQLEAQYLHRQNGLRFQPPMPGQPPMYPGQPVFYTAPNPALPPQAQRQFIYPQQLVARPGFIPRAGPGANQRAGPGFAPMPQQYMVPVAQRGGPGGRQQRARGGPQQQNAPQQQGQAGMPAGKMVSGPGGAPAGAAGNRQRGGVQQQPRAAAANGGGGGARVHGVEYTATARNQGREQPQPATAGQPMPQAQPRMPEVNEPLTATALAAMPEEQQKQIIGERLYPLIAAKKPELAGKITGMLLEMDNSELLHLLESPTALDEKITEAMEVLEAHAPEMDGDDAAAEATA